MVQPLGRTSVSDFDRRPAGSRLQDTLLARPSSFPALPSRFKSFQIVTTAVDNLREPAGDPFLATQR